VLNYIAKCIMLTAWYDPLYCPWYCTEYQFQRACQDKIKF